MDKLKVLELFAGIGGFHLGLKDSKHFETIAFCELDSQCREVLNKISNSQTPIFKDITKINIQNTSPYELNKYVLMDLDEINSFENKVPETFYHGEIDVVTASWPCQGHSTAGKKRGLKDERSGLWKEVKRILQESQPKWFIGENSANLRSNGLTEVLQDLWEVGYDNIRWDILPAESYGAIHKRERIFIIANSHGIRLSEQSFAPSKTEQIRRAEAWTSFSNGSCPKPTVCGVVDGISKKLQRDRREQVKQYGNALWPIIISKIGEYIVEKELSHDLANRT